MTSRHAAGVPLLVVLPLGEDPAVALRALEALAALEPEPAHHVAIVAPDHPPLRRLLTQLEGDVTILDAPDPSGDPVAAWIAALDASLPGDDALLLAGPVAPPSGAVGALEATLDESVAALLPGTEPGRLSAVAADRVLLRAALAAMPAPDASAAHPGSTALLHLALTLAAHGAVRPAPTAPAASLDGAAPTTDRGAVHAGGTGAAMVGAGGRRDARGRGAHRPGGAPEVSIVVPTLDATGPRLQACLRALQAHTDAPHELLVIDNGAPAQGFTAPVNAGLRAARGRYLVVCNDDVRVRPGWWAPLRAALDDGAPVAFPLTVDGAMREDFAAWCFALTADTIDRFRVAPGEFLHPELRVWFQDTDLLLRLRAAGTPPRLVRSSTVTHGLSETVATTDPALRAWIDEQVLADRARFRELHAGTGVVVTEAA
ncbi:hypothetical protein SK069_14570 [Patulibacter brassicae]|uniref:Glycosyltransferase 2-like domain-containing protein n=1 Tax=Patulibacter brassicae TaxID=1705717 RepID=A0ABU4VNB6_9ACTN|nr:glycosyltransferase [Patulibacter brassicae]MDX8152822.1 hypothetical protein [Patulibacter brassicae]